MADQTPPDWAVEPQTQTPQAPPDWAMAGPPAPQAPPSSVTTAINAIPGAKMLANVVPDVVLGPAEFLSHVANTGADLLEKYGIAGPSPTIGPLGNRITGRIPSPTAGVKAAAGIPTFAPGSVGQEVENYLATTGQLAAGNLGSLRNINWGQVAPAIGRAFTRGAVADVAGQVASAAGGTVAGAIDPRLEQAGRLLGPVAAFSAPWEQVGSRAVGASGFRAPNAGATYDAASRIAQNLNLPEVPVTAGALGGHGVQGLETLLGWTPGVASRQAAMHAALPAQVEQAAQMVSPHSQLETQPGGPGAQFTDLARADLSRRWGTAKMLTDTIENHLSNQPTGTGELRLVPLQPLTQRLQGLQTRAFGPRDYAQLSPAQSEAVNSLIDSLNGMAVPQDMALHNQLNANIARNQTLANHPQTPPSLVPHFQNAIAQDQAALLANMGTPFEPLRRIKSELGNQLEGSIPIDRRTTLMLHNALGDHIQQFANQSGPLVGPAYQAARGLYQDAMNTREALESSPINPVGTAISPTRYADTPGATALTDQLAGLLRNPEKAAAVQNAPYWPQVLASTVGRLGLPGGVRSGEPFSPGLMAQQWSAGVPGRGMMTGNDPQIQSRLDDAATLARAIAGTGTGQPRLRQSIAHGATVASLLAGGLERIMNHGVLHALPLVGGLVGAGHALGSAPVVRMFAGRPEPMQTQIRRNAPALQAVLAQQARTQNQP